MSVREEVNALCLFCLQAYGHRQRAIARGSAAHRMGLKPYTYAAVYKYSRVLIHIRINIYIYVYLCTYTRARRIMICTHTGARIWRTH